MKIDRKTIEFGRIQSDSVGFGRIQSNSVGFGQNRYKKSLKNTLKHSKTL
jgi:hypothetical protein